MGLVAARDLAESKLVDRVVIGDMDPSKAEKMVREVGHGKISTVKVDAAKHDDLVKTIRGSSVMINAIWFEHNLRVMKAAIEARVHYNDLGGLFHMTRKQLELNEQAKKAGVTVVLGGGESPGITNVMCASSAERMDSVQEIRIRVGGVEKGKHSSEKLAFPFAISTVFDEYSKPPVMFVDGRFQEMAPLSGEEEVEFPPPVGRNRCHYSLHSEIATLPFSFKGLRLVDFKLGISEKTFKAIKPLLDAGLDDSAPIEVKGHKVSPREFAIAFLASRSSGEEPVRHVAIRTQVTGVRVGRRLRNTQLVVAGPSEKLGVKNATGFLTGVGASIVAQFVLNGKIGKRGVLAPETCVPPGPFKEELEMRGVTILAEETRLVG